MKDLRSVFRPLAIILWVTLTGVAANAPALKFKFTTIDVSGGTGTAIFAVNNAGVMVGTYLDFDGVVYHGFMRKAGKVTTIDHPDSLMTLCHDVNSKLAVVGLYYNSIGVVQGFLYKGGIFTEVPGPVGATSSRAYGIDDQGNIVGGYTDSIGNLHGFLLKGATYTTLDVPGAIATTARGINRKGTITMDWWNSATSKNLLFTTGKSTLRLMSRARFRPRRDTSTPLGT